MLDSIHCLGESMELMDVLDPATVNPLIRNVSNSEVTTFLSCKRQYEYAFMMELAPIKTGDPLARGSVFHYAMERYWTHRMAGTSHEQAMLAATEEAFQLPSPGDPTATADVVMNAQFLWTRYMEYHAGFPDWEPLGTEVKVELPLTSTITMAIKYDFYFKEISTGKCYILDYKLAYEFWTPEDHDLNGQMAKYIAVLQANGIQCDGGYLEEIRTRNLGAEKQRNPKNLWRRTRYVPSGARKQSVLRQHVAASLEIEKFRALPLEDRKNAALPVLNKHGVCKFCNFKDLCVAEIEGKKDLSVDIRVGYTSSSYAQGYNPSNNNGTDF
jgi:hypothetical protein